MSDYWRGTEVWEYPPIIGHAYNQIYMYVWARTSYINKLQDRCARLAGGP